MTRSSIRERGWSDSMIDRMLTPVSGSGARACYLRSAVIDAEMTQEFRDAIFAGLRRPVARAEVSVDDLANLYLSKLLAKERVRSLD